MAEDETSNRVTLALVDAKVKIVDTKVEGLGDLIKSENATTREAIRDLKDLPAQVAQLRSDLTALDKREAEADVGMGRRVDAIETTRAQMFSWKATALITFVAAAIGGLIGHVHVPTLP